MIIQISTETSLYAVTTTSVKLFALLTACPTEHLLNPLIAQPTAWLNQLLAQATAGHQCNRLQRSLRATVCLLLVYYHKTLQGHCVPLRLLATSPESVEVHS